MRHLQQSRTQSRAKKKTTEALTAKVNVERVAEPTKKRFALSRVRGEPFFHQGPFQYL